MDVDDKEIRARFDRDLAPMIACYIAKLLEAGPSHKEADQEAFEAFQRWVDAALEEIDGDG
jgi:hypothetical protein